MYWNDLDGTILLGKVFSQPVKIGAVDLFDIKIDREGPTILINFDLINELPDNPPSKWGKDFNKCRCGINCGGVTSLSIQGVNTSMLAKVDISFDKGPYKVGIEGENFSINFECQHLNFTGPSVYTSK